MSLIARIPKNSREEYRVTSETFKGTPLVHFRIWYRRGDDEFAPSHKGVAIHPDQLQEVITALKAASDQKGEVA